MARFDVGAALARRGLIITAYIVALSTLASGAPVAERDVNLIPIKEGEEVELARAWGKATADERARAGLGLCYDGFPGSEASGAACNDCGSAPTGLCMASCGQCCTDTNCGAPKIDEHGSVAFPNFEISSELPLRKLTSAERRTYERRGVVVLRGVIPRREVALELARQSWRHSEAFDFAEYTSDTWTYSPVSRALVMSNLSALAKDIMQVRGFSLIEAPIWGKRGTGMEERNGFDTWHADDSRDIRRSDYHNAS